MPKIVKRFTLQDMYKNYLKENPIKTKDYLTFKEFRTTVMKIMDTVIYEYIFEGYTYSIPKLHFKLALQKFKASQRLVDWKSTNEYRAKYDDPDKLIYYKNFHTGGYTVRLKLSKPRHKFQLVRNRGMFMFKAARKVNRELAQQVKNTNILNKIYN